MTNAYVSAYARQLALTSDASLPQRVGALAAI
jgi:hypothetical protein